MAKPVSSSTVMKTKPLAVLGRWRTITRPAMRTRRPFGMWASSAARMTPRRSRAGRANDTGCGPVEIPPAWKSASLSSAAVISGSGAAASFAAAPAKSAPDLPIASTCHSACRRVPPSADSAPISASVASSRSFAWARAAKSGSDANAAAARAASIRLPVSSRRPDT